MKARLEARRAAIVVLAALALGCGSTPPPSLAPAPSATPSATPTPGATPTPSAQATSEVPVTPTPSASPPPKTVGDLALEECDPQGLLPCEHQAVVLAAAVGGAPLALTYSTEWADARTDRPEWNAQGLGLSGWSLNVLQRYDTTNKVLLSGDGTWRIATAVDIGNGQMAIPTYDGLKYFVFDSAWRHVRTVDSVTGTTLLTFTYDDAGLLSTVKGQNNGSLVDVSVERGTGGGLRGLTANGATTTTVALGIDGQVASIFQSDGTTLRLDTAPFGLITAWTASGRGPNTYKYDSSGRVISATDGDGVTNALSFDNSGGGVTVTATSPSGGASAMRAEHGADGFLRTWTDSDGTVTTLETKADGSSVLTEPDGTITTIVNQPHPRWGMAAPVQVQFAETRPVGAKYVVDTASTMDTGSAEPAGGPWKTTTTVDGNQWVDSYEPSTRTLTSTDPSGRPTTRVFDELARIVEYSEPGAPPQQYTYDDAGRLASLTLGTDESAATTTYTYDAAAGTVTQTNPDGSTSTTRFGSFDNEIGVQADGQSSSVVRDASGKAIELRSGDHPATGLGYSAAGRQTSFIPPVVGDDSSYGTTTYTAAGLIDTITGPGPRSIKMSYDNAGRVTGWQYSRASATATYDNVTGLLTRNATLDGVSTSFSYSGWVPTGISWAGPFNGSVEQTVDDLLRTTEQFVNGEDPISFTYDQSGVLTTIDQIGIQSDATTGLPASLSTGAVSESRTYDPDGRLMKVAVSVGAQSVAELDYTFDSMGRIASVDRTIQGVKTSVAYTYDASGRLKSGSTNGAPESYGYDSAGNRTAITSSAGAGTATYDDRDRLVSDRGATFEYTPYGSLASRTDGTGTTAFFFDDFGELVAANLPDGHGVNYVLDAGGRRIGRLVDNQPTDGYLYDTDGNLVAWLDGAGKVVDRFAYDDAGNLTLVIRDAKKYFVVTDQLGSPLLLIDSATGKVADALSYDAWGNLTQETTPGLIPFGFAGGLRDPLTGFVHFGVRDYDPITGRWTSVDPLGYDGGDSNLYRYAAATRSTSPIRRARAVQPVLAVAAPPRAALAQVPAVALGAAVARAPARAVGITTRAPVEETVAAKDRPRAARPRAARPKATRLIPIRRTTGDRPGMTCSRVRPEETTTAPSTRASCPCAAAPITTATSAAA